MQITIEAPFSVSDLQKETIQQKMDELEKYSINITRGSIYFKKGDSDQNDIIIGEVELHVPGPTIFSSAESVDFMEAFNAALNKSRRQLVKMKEKMVDHHN